MKIGEKKAERKQNILGISLEPPRNNIKSRSFIDVTAKS